MKNNLVTRLAKAGLFGSMLLMMSLITYSCDEGESKQDLEYEISRLQSELEEKNNEIYDLKNELYEKDYEINDLERRLSYASTENHGNEFNMDQARNKIRDILWNLDDYDKDDIEYQLRSVYNLLNY